MECRCLFDKIRLQPYRDYTSALLFVQFDVLTFVALQNIGFKILLIAAWIAPTVASKSSSQVVITSPSEIWMPALVGYDSRFHSYNLLGDILLAVSRFLIDQIGIYLELDTFLCVSIFDTCDYLSQDIRVTAAVTKSWKVIGSLFLPFGSFQW